MIFFRAGLGSLFSSDSEEESLVVDEVVEMGEEETEAKADTEVRQVQPSKLSRFVGHFQKRGGLWNIFWSRVHGVVAGEGGTAAEIPITNWRALFWKIVVSRLFSWHISSRLNWMKAREDEV